MKKYHYKRVLALSLSLVLSLMALWPCLAAEATDISIDTSVFGDEPTIDHVTIYIWRRGMPEVRSSSDVLKARDILLTWDGCYYLSVDNYSFYQTMDDYYSMYDQKGYPKYNDLEAYEPGKIPADQIRYANGFYYYDKDGFYPCGYPSGGYRYVVSYLSPVKLTASLPLNFSALREAGVSATFNPVNGLPVAGYIEQKDGIDQYYLGTFHKGKDHSFGGLTFSDDVIMTWKGNSVFESFERKESFLIFFSSTSRYNYMRMCMNHSVKDCVVEDGGRYLEGVISGGDKWSVLPGTQENTVRLMCHADTASSLRGGIKYEVDDMVRMFHSPPDTVGLGHLGFLFQSVGNAVTRVYKPGSPHDEIVYEGESPYWAGERGDFDVFWCEPTIMDIIRTDFTVENGQVSNLDGPIALADCTVTVKEGGTLTISNWVANQGTIIVEEGGTLYIQDDACLCRINDGEHEGGGVISNGLIIVGDNAKLCGGGVDGIQLLDGSHVVNYGLVTSENFKITQPYTVENRGQNAAVFYGEGNGVTGSGMGTWGGSAGPSGYVERGQVERPCTVDVADNAVYNYD